jgi:ribosomal-protein-serine acetyltransferase
MFVRELGEGDELRLLEARHADALFALVRENEARLRQWVPWLKHVGTVDGVANLIRRRLHRLADGSGWAAGIWHCGRLAGEIGFDFIDGDNRSAEIGYWVAAASEGKGLVSRACRALIEHAFMELDLTRVQIRCAVENRRSRSIPERLGFTLEGRLRSAERLHDRYVDLAVYGLLASEWRPSAGSAPALAARVPGSTASEERIGDPRIPSPGR